jgi:hypothetical protein
MDIPGEGLLVRIEHKWILDVSDLRHSGSLPSPMILRVGADKQVPVQPVDATLSESFDLTVLLRVNGSIAV